MSILLPISIVIYTLDAVITLTKAVQYLHDLTHDEETKRHLFLTTHNIYQSTTHSCKSLFKNLKEKVLDTGQHHISHPEEKWILLVEVEDDKPTTNCPDQEPSIFVENYQDDNNTQSYNPDEIDNNTQSYNPDEFNNHTQSYNSDEVKNNTQSYNTDEFNNHTQSYNTDEFNNHTQSYNSDEFNNHTQSYNSDEFNNHTQSYNTDEFNNHTQSYNTDEEPSIFFECDQEDNTIPSHYLDDVEEPSIFFEN